MGCDWPAGLFARFDDDGTSIYVYEAEPKAVLMTDWMLAGGWMLTLSRAGGQNARDCHDRLEGD
jgi:hypothetical protein